MRAIPVRLHVVALALLLGASAAAQDAPRTTLTVLTHESFNASTAVLDAFTERTGIALEFLPAGDAGAVVNRAVLTKARPIADVLYGVDNSLIVRAADEGVFEPYVSPRLEAVPEALRFADEGLVTPVDVGYVNFNLDLAWFAENDVPLPQDLDDLTEERYRGLTAVANPATSSPGLAFLLTTVARYGEGGEGDWLDYWAAFRSNDVLVTEGWSDAYYGAFTRYGGDRPIVLSYASSPAAEVIFAEEPLDEAPTANLFCGRCVWRQIEAAGILAGTDEREAAETFLDFLLSEAFQEDVPGQMFVYPVIEGADLPPEFEAFAQVPAEAQVASLPPEAIAEGQARWLERWTQVVEQGRRPEAVR